MQPAHTWLKKYQLLIINLLIAVHMFIVILLKIDVRIGSKLKTLVEQAVVNHTFVTSVRGLL